MILDILLGGWLILATLMGFRDGVVRKGVSAAMTIVSLILSQVFMRDAADVLVESAGVDPANAPVLGALTVFFGVMTIQSLVYRFATGPYKIGGIGDRVAGSVVGLFQGVLFLSAFLFLMTLIGFPSKSFKRDSRIYKGVVNIAPQILDQVMTLGPETLEHLKEMSSSGSEVLDADRPSPAPRRVPAASNRRIDSLQAAPRR